MTASAESAINIADKWLNEHRVSETWRVINMLRDELVLSIGREVNGK